MATILFTISRVKWMALLALTCFAGIAAAQSQRPEPGTDVVPSQNEAGESAQQGTSSDDETPKDAGFVRVFNFASGYKDRLAIFLSKGSLGESSQPSDLGTLLRGSHSPDIRDYEAFAPGDYQLLVRKEDTTDFSDPDPTKLISAYKPGQELIPPLKITVKPKSNISIFIWTSGTKFQAQAIQDGATSVRVCNFVAASPISITAGTGDNPATLGQNIPIGISGFPKTNQGSDSMFSLIFPGPSGAPMTRITEVQTQSAQGVTLVAYYDKYGRVQFRGFADSGQPTPQ